MFTIYETTEFFIISLNGEQLKVVTGSRHATYVQRWGCNGWRHFVDLPVLNPETAKQAAISIILKLTGECLPHETDPDYPPANGR